MLEISDYIFIDVDCKILLSVPLDKLKIIYRASISDSKTDPDYARKQIAAKNLLFDLFNEKSIYLSDIKKCVLSGEAIKEVVKNYEPEFFAEDEGQKIYSDIKI